MPHIRTNDGVTLHYEDAGHGKPILLLGGWCMGTRWWCKQVDELARDFRVIALDARASGQSEKTPRGHWLGRYAHDVFDLLTALDLRDVTAVGWSLGAATLFAYVELFRTERLRGLILVDQSPYPITTEGWERGNSALETQRDFAEAVRSDQAAVVEGFVPYLFYRVPGLEEQAWMVADMLQTPAVTAAAIVWNYVNHDWRDVLPSVNLPTLVVAGRHDQVFPWQAGAYVAERLPAAEFMVFEKSGHCPFYEEPEAFNSALARFAASLASMEIGADAENSHRHCVTFRGA